ncbi:glycosyltransferase family 2 protein [Luteimonas sp. XNQY3]|nr:glycosyltransferase family 2 protein [Luteimonas sp. XNQY3]MCD9005781.1 glycosyltransferase family 2 protein [Luteimonas sp. XNQY3]
MAGDLLEVVQPDGGVMSRQVIRQEFPPIVSLVSPNARVERVAADGSRVSLDAMLEPIPRSQAARSMVAAIMLAGRNGQRGVLWVQAAMDLVLRRGRGLGALLFAHYVLALHARTLSEHSLPPVEIRGHGPAMLAAPPLVALRGLEYVGGAHAQWRALDDDGGFLVEATQSGLPARAGWYRLSLQMQATSGALIAPALYPDYGGGCSQTDVIHLPEPDAQGRIDCIVLFRRALHRMRFDPSVRTCTFDIRRMLLRQVGRPAALMGMLAKRSPDGRLDWTGSRRQAMRFTRMALANGLSSAVSALEAPQEVAGDYAAWVRRYDQLHRDDLQALAARVAALPRTPCISLVVPVYNTPARWLRRCIESVREQAYPNWELCLANDASPAPHVSAILDAYAASDPRIRVVHRERNGHICEASNSALALANGEWTGLLDHDDELRPHALLRVVEAIVGNPTAKLLYSDEDKIDAAGQRFDPNFKPDWNPDLLRSQNYICHFTVIRTDLVRDVGGFIPGFEGSQDHDLFLRCTESLESREVHHIPEILYHWRAIEGSTALSRDSKDYAGLAGERAVRAHLARTGADADVTLLQHGHYRVSWAVPTPAPAVSIIVPTRDRVALLRDCVESVLGKSTYPDFEIVVVDNQSSDPETLVYLADLEVRPRVRVIRYNAPFNYSAINNYAVAHCSGELVVLLNNDIEVIEPAWLEEMAGFALRPDVGAVGCMLLYPDWRIQHAGVVLGVQGVANHFYQHQRHGVPGHGARALVAQNLSAVTGACLMVRRSLYEEVGGLDEKLAVAFNDVDFCLRVREAGYRNVWTPFALHFHHESASRGVEDSPEKMARFKGEVERMRARWASVLDEDPAYNPNLTLDAVGCGLAFPPRGATSVLGQQTS